MVYGSKEGGLFNFIDHVANKQMLKERHVIVLDFHSFTSTLSEWLEDIKYHIEQFLHLEHKFKNIWVLLSKNG